MTILVVVVVVVHDVASCGCGGSLDAEIVWGTGCVKQRK